MIRPVIQRALRIGAARADAAEAESRALVAELTARLRSEATLNTLGREENRRLRAANEALSAENTLLRAAVYADSDRLRRTLLDYEDQLQWCREHHGGNGRGSSVLVNDPTIAEILAEKRWVDR